VKALAENEAVARTLAQMRELVRQEALELGAANFSRDDATRLYLEAHARAANATEEIKAVDSLVKLHGLAEPEKREVKVTRRDQLQELDDDALMELTGEEILLDPSQYVVTNE
jgi:hypothetical protein